MSLEVRPPNIHLSPVPVALKTEVPVVSNSRPGLTSIPCLPLCHMSRCDSFTLSASLECQLRTGRPFMTAASEDAPPPDFEYSIDVLLSCFKYGLDFASAGHFGAMQLLGERPC